MQQQVIWWAIQVYAQAATGAWNSSTVQPVLKPHNFMINTPKVVQNLTVQVLKVEEGF